MSRVRQTAYLSSVKPSRTNLTREEVFAHMALWGVTGIGKTNQLARIGIDKYNMGDVKIDNQTFPGFKVVWFDVSGKGEMAAACVPMTEDHPLYPVLLETGGEPEYYPVKVYMPLVYVRGVPYLQPLQPKVVEPFTLDLSGLTMDDWEAILGGLSPGQRNLLDSSINDLTLGKMLETATVQDLIKKIEELALRDEAGFTAGIDGLDAPVIAVDQKVYGSRESQRLLQKLQAVLRLQLILPHGTPTNLDVHAMLEDRESIAVFCLAPIEDAPGVNMAIVNTVLSKIQHLKVPQNADRVKVPVALFFPEFKDFCPKSIDDESLRYRLTPIRSRLKELTRKGGGWGIVIHGDSQVPGEIDDGFRGNIKISYIFNLGEQAAQKLKIILKDRGVSNIEHIFNPKILSLLNHPGNFVYLPYGSNRAEPRRGRVPGIYWPRRVKEGETETNFWDTYEYLYPKENYPERWQDVTPKYRLVAQINKDIQTRLAFIAREKKEKEKKRAKPGRPAGKERLEALEALLKVCGDQKKASFLKREIRELLMPLVKKSYQALDNDLEDFQKHGVMTVDENWKTRPRKARCFIDPDGLKAYGEEIRKSLGE